MSDREALLDGVGAVIELVRPLHAKKNEMMDADITMNIEPICTIKFGGVASLGGRPTFIALQAHAHI